MTTARIPPEPSEPSADDAVARLMELTGDIAVLPAGSRLADENRSGHQCFVILDGAAVVEREGLALRRLGSGAFVGDVSPDGRPLPPGRVTVRIEARSHVLVLDSVQLYLSPKTIEYHLAHIFAKLGIRTRYQLAARVRS
jgi:Bacterial regulatory proteins, luxR family